MSVQLQLAPQFRNKTVYNELVLHSVLIPRSTVWKSVFPLQPDCKYLTRTKILSMPGTGYFLKVNSQQKNQRVLVSWMLYGRSSGYHSFKQKQGLFYSFNPHRTMARSHTTRNRDFLEPISFSFSIRSVRGSKFPVAIYVLNLIEYFEFFNPAISKIWQKTETISNKV